MDRLFVIDLDGTLLNDDKKITSYSEENIKKILSKKNNHIIFASGRSYNDMKRYIKQCNLKNYVICNDGTKIYHTNGTLYKEYNNLTVEDIIKFDNEIFNYFYYFNIRTNSKEYIYHRNFFSLVIYLLKKIIKKKNCKLITKKELENKNISKLIVNNPFIQKNKKIKITQKISKKINYNIFYMTLDNKIQISSKNVNKFIAIEEIRKKLRIDKENIYVFGNDGNDKEMLLNYKNSYVVNNASNDTISNAKNIIEDNNNDGVVKTIMKIVGE